MNFANFNIKNTRELADSEAIYQRGQQYCKSGAVHKIKWEDNKLFAKVFGGHDQYKVEIIENKQGLDCECTCPYDGINCKHIVAALLTFLNQRDQLKQQVKKDQTRQKSLKHHLMQLDKKVLVELLISSTKKHKHWKSVLLQKVADRLSDSEVKEDLSSVYLEQYQSLADRAFAIIHEHNEYGGGPEYEEDQAYSLLEKINKLFKDHKLPDDLKREYIDTLFKYYDWGNSGMVDMLMDSIEEACETNDDWQYLISKLQKKTKDKWGWSYRQQLIARIYKNKLNNDQAYLDIRMQNLEHSGDYYDLVTYWENKGEIGKAIEVAKEGIKKTSRGGELLEFLFKHYKASDYQQALGYLKQIFEESPGLENYRRLNKFTNPDDWPMVDEKCRKTFEKHRPFELALIHQENKEYDKVLEYVLSKNNDYGFYYDGGSEKDQLAVGLIEHFPNEMLSYFQGKVQKHIDLKQRSHYQRASVYATYVKNIYCQYLKKRDGWQIYLNDIRTRHAKQPALLDEFKSL